MAYELYIGGHKPGFSQDNSLGWNALNRRIKHVQWRIYLVRSFKLGNFLKLSPDFYN